MQKAATSFILGRKEWVALPELGLGAIKAKVDTGARTSALHAQSIETFGSASTPKLRFVVQPLPERPDIEILCQAPVLDRRDVTSSSGGTETRYIIETEVRIGPRAWRIEIGLTNRESLAHRMLLGRQAIQPGMLVDPARTFCQAKLSARAYGK